MIDYKEYENDDDFMAILNYLRGYSLADEWEVAEILDIDLEIVNKHYRLAQSIVAEEIQDGEITNDDADIALNYIDFLSN